MAKNATVIRAQAAAIPYRWRDDGKLEFLIITSMRAKKWIVPKGIVSWGLTPIEAAAQEAWEEAGVRGDINPCRIGMYQYEKFGGLCLVEVFLMEVNEIHADWPEREYRKRRWYKSKKAVKKLKQDALKELATRARKVLKKQKKLEAEG